MHHMTCEFLFTLSGFHIFGLMIARPRLGAEFVMNVGGGRGGVGEEGGGERGRGGKADNSGRA